MENQAQERVNLFIPLLVIIFVGSIVVIIYYVSERADENIIRANIPVEEIPELTLQEAEQKISECSSGRTIHQQDWCYLNIAKSFRIDSCARIINHDFKKYCEAIILSDVKNCDDIYANSVQDACYISLATITRDVSICAKSQRKDFCESLF